MNAVRFHAVIGEDQVIRPPAGIQLTPGQAEVIVLQPELAGKIINSPSQTTKEHLFDRLAKVAQKLGINTSDLPTDLAENHDHYLHGLPKPFTIILNASVI